MREGVLEVCLTASVLVNFYLLYLCWRWAQFGKRWLVDMELDRDD